MLIENLRVEIKDSYDFPHHAIYLTIDIDKEQKIYKRVVPFTYELASDDHMRQITRELLRTLSQEIAEKLLEEHIEKAVLGLNSKDPAQKALAVLALKAGL